jgi:hypothetical protein
MRSNKIARMFWQEIDRGELPADVPGRERRQALRRRRLKLRRIDGKIECRWRASLPDEFGSLVQG